MDLVSVLPVVAIVLGVVAIVVGLAALLLGRRLTAALRRVAPTASVDPRLEHRRGFANLMRRYSELLGVEVVTGRIPNRGDNSVDLRVRLETALRTMREPGAVELLDEVGFARDALVDIEPARRAAANGLVAMEVEWSIERWVANPRAWLADTREQDRLSRIAHSQPHAERLAAAS